MKVTRFLKTIAIGIALVLAVGLGSVSCAWALDKNHPDITLVDNRSDSTYVQVIATGIAQGMYPIGYNPDGTPIWDTRPTYFSQTGTGCVVGDQFVVTAAHVVVPQVVDTVWGRNSIFRAKPMSVIERTVWIRDFKSEPTLTWIHFIDEEQDIAILRFVNEPKQFEPIPYEWCIDSGWIQAGDAIVVVTKMRNDDDSLNWACTEKKGHILKMGIVSSIPEEAMPWFSLYDITMDVNIIPGDSGSPVFGFMNGVPVFIGVARAGYNDGYQRFSFFALLGNIQRYLDINY